MQSQKGNLAFWVFDFHIFIGILEIFAMQGSDFVLPHQLTVHNFSVIQRIPFHLILKHIYNLNLDSTKPTLTKMYSIFHYLNLFLMFFKNNKE